MTREAYYRSLTDGQVETIRRFVWNAAGSSAAGMDNILQGRSQITVVPCVQSFFDRNGRCIPAQSVRSAVCDANRDYFFTQPVLEYAKRLARMHQYLSFLDPITMTADEFERQSTVLLAELCADVRFANALSGVFLPIVVPAMAVTDYGETLESISR
jgi:hypothetical protein